MKVPLSWIKEYVDIDLPIEDLVRRLTLAGLEVEEIQYVGYPLPEGDLRREAKITGFAWEPDKIVVGAILEVMPHPDADKLVLCQLDDGEQIHTVLTGAPNLYQFKGKGPLDTPIKVAYAKEGATIINAYEPGNKPTKLKRKKIRGVESYSMACSERELGISDEHEGIIILDEDAPVGVPLVEYIGDVVFDIAITPNMARDANVIGVAREIAAITGSELRYPDLEIPMDGPPLEGRVKIEITDPEINPRFVFGMIENIEIQPSPYKVQLRLQLAGMRPIDALVDATNYAMLELGEPLHAFDYDVLHKRAKDHAERTLSGEEGEVEGPTIITRAAAKGEKLVTLDDVERTLDDFTVMVCDQSGSLALAGVMGGQESEISENTTNVLLEGASWNIINTRRTVISQNLPSEAAYRFSRGVHPEMAPKGVLRGLKLMHEWAGGTIAKGLVDEYPLPPVDPIVEISPEDVCRWLGIELSAEEIVAILESLEFECQLTTDHQPLITVKTPDHRLDIGTGVIGKADLMEEIARVYGYDRIPETRMSDDLPPQKGNLDLEIEDGLRDLLVGLGLQEVITHRLTSPDRESRRLSPDSPPDDTPYFALANPITPERSVLRHSLLASVIEIIERNARIRERIAVFEINPVFVTSEEGDPSTRSGQGLPDEIKHLVIALTGPRAQTDWAGADTAPMDFFDLKGIVDSALRGLHLEDIRYEVVQHPSFHPGKCAQVLIGKTHIGIMGELHPQVKGNYDLPEAPLLAADFGLAAIIEAVPERYDILSIASQPPMLEDIALILDENIPANEVEALIRQTGGRTVTDVRLFDIYRGKQIGVGKKSLAYSLTYQNPERTLTDKDAAKLRNKIVKRLERELGAQLRG
ncbi:MAG: phenylalanine--tRNA ligase subunit beta [Anaerolineales bacterium]|nr:phenylalanine--tRNA ligase subunit beta [Chloroflexota bacterium]MBL6981932.1 phenylalanine--tRNA ligase subunit beta [Anaerolineales bacterium]